MDRSARCSGMLVGMLTAAGLAALGSAGVAAVAADATTGSWQNHEVTFNYMGDTTAGSYYSCQGLRDTLTFLVTQSGGRVNGPIQITPCVGGAGAPSTLLSARMNISTFTPAGEEGGQGAAAAGDWRKVLFSAPHSSPTLDFGSCELVEQFRDKLLGYFATRNLQSNLRCIPFQRDMFGLSFEAFVPSDTPHRAVGGR